MDTERHSSPFVYCLYLGNTAIAVQSKVHLGKACSISLKRKAVTNISIMLAWLTYKKSSTFPH